MTGSKRSEWISNSSELSKPRTWMRNLIIGALISTIILTPVAVLSGGKVKVGDLAERVKLRELIVKNAIQQVITHLLSQGYTRETLSTPDAKRQIRKLAIEQLKAQGML